MKKPGSGSFVQVTLEELNKKFQPGMVVEISKRWSKLFNIAGREVENNESNSSDEPTSNGRAAEEIKLEE